MQEFKVSLSRVYSVTVHAKNKQRAKELAEYFIGNPEDKSSNEDRRKYKFLIEKIEMKVNEVFEMQEI